MLARRWIAVLVAAALVALSLVAAGGPANAVGTVGGFEIDGNRVDDAAPEIDWLTPPPNLVSFTDADAADAIDDDIFTGGSKNQEPGGWECGFGSAPQKDDLLSGDIAFRTDPVSGDVFAYVDFFRKARNGSANVDWEFNQSNEPNPACPELPQRTDGDLVIAYDATNGGAVITVRLFEWAFAPGSTTVGAFTEILGQEHVTWDGAAGFNNTYGEASINLTDALDTTVACGSFSTVFMKTRASHEISAALKDRTEAQPFNPGNCPVSELTKSVRNVTTDGAFATTANASAGDTIEYQLSYENNGNATATGVVITDEVPADSTFLSCSNSCQTSATAEGSTITWNIGTVTVGNSATVTFQTVLDPTFAANTTTITNVATTDNDQEDPDNSNPTEVIVAAPPASGLGKAVRNVTSDGAFATSADASPGDTIEYQFVYENDGTGPASNVTITDEVPAHSTFASCSNSCAVADGVITWTLGTIAAGDTATVTFRTILDDKFADNSTTIVNVGTTDSDEEAPSDSNSTSVTVAADPESDLDKAVRNVTTDGTFASSANALPGNTIEYQFTYTNTGSGPATATITDEVPEHSTFDSCSNSCGTNGTAAGSTITWNLGTIAAGDSVTVTFRTILDDTFAQNSTTITNVGTATDQTGSVDSNPTEVIVDAQPETDLDKAVRNVTTEGVFAASANASPSDTIEYRLTYTNTGTGPATVTITDEVPEHSTFVSCSNSCDASGTAAGSTIIWDLGTLPAGDLVTVTFQTILDATFAANSTTIDNVATATDQNGPTDSNPTEVTVSAQPESNLAKAVRNVTTDGTFGTSANASPSDTIEYQFTYTNSGTGPATASITDEVPAHSTFDSCSNSCTVAGGIVTWNLGTVAAGDSVTVTFRTILDATFAENATTITNVGTASDQNGSVESNPTEVIVDAQPETDLDKAVRNVTTDGTFGTSANASPGDTIEYQFTYTNIGSGPADVTITDEVPAHSTFDSCSNSCTVAGGTITWNLGTVAAGDDVIVTFRTILDATFAENATTITNVGTATDQNGPDDSNPTEVIVDAQPDSELAKAVRNVSTEGTFGTSADALPGHTIEYQFTYTNTGTGPAHNVTITDEVPEHSTFDSCSDNCTTEVITAGTTAVNWNVGTILAGDSVTVTFRTILDDKFADNSTTIVNVGRTDSDEEAPSDSNSTSVTVAADPHSELAKAVRNVTNDGTFATSANAVPGDTIEYQFTYKNTGSGPANDVTITDEVPAHSTFDSCSNSCTVAGGTITWTLGTIPAGESVTVTFQTVLDDTFEQNSTTIVNVGKATDHTGSVDSNPTEVLVDAQPKTDLDKAVRNVTTDGAFASSADAKPGHTIEYQFTYTNIGTGPANVTITDEVPAHSTFVSCSNNCTVAGGIITWDLGTIAAGDIVTVTFRTILDDTFAENSTTITNIGTATDQNGPENSNPTEVIVDAQPETDLAKAVRNVSTDGTFASSANASPGDTIEYQFVYKNVGSGPANNVTITDEVPAHSTFVSCSNSCTNSGTAPGSLITWALGNVAAGDSVTVTFRTLLDAGFPANDTTITNIGTATDQNGPEDSNPTEVVVHAEPDMKLAKSADGTEFSAGEIITYTLAYANNGDGHATNVVIEDTIPAHTEFVGCTGDCTFADGTATWNIGDVPAGTSGTVTLSLRVLPTTTCSLCNQASIASPDQDGGARPSNRLCVDGLPGPRPELANASGSAYGVDVDDTTLGIHQDPPIAKVDSAQSGVGSDDDSTSVVSVAVPADGSVAKAKVISTSSESTVSQSPAEANSEDFAETANVNLLNGVVKAQVVRAYVNANATGFNSSVSSVGSTIKGLVINGVAQNTITPNKRVGLPAAAFGAGSYVAIYEETKSTGVPTGLSGGTYSGDITVNMIRVHVTDKLAAQDTLGLFPPQPLEIVVSSATAHADFPQVTLCTAKPAQSVNGHAFNLSETTDPDLAAIMQGFSGPLPSNGGLFNQGYNKGAVPDNGSGATTATWTSETYGRIRPDSHASSYAEAKDVCVLRNTTTGVCTISAKAIRSQANSTATAASAASNPDGTVLLSVNVLGDPINSAPNNKVVDLPGIGFVILNEQIADAASAGHTGITVRAIHLVITKATNPFNLPIGADVIVAEAKTGATYIA